MPRYAAPHATFLHIEKFCLSPFDRSSIGRLQFTHGPTGPIALSCQPGTSPPPPTPEGGDHDRPRSTASERARPAPGPRPRGDRRMGGLPGRRHQGRGPAPCRVPHAALAPARGGRRYRAAQAAGDRLHQHHPHLRGARLRRRPGDGVPDHRLEPLERGRDGHPGRALRRRRPHRHLRLGRLAVRDRLQPLLPRQGGRRLRRPDLRPGPRLARRLRPRLPRRPPQRAAARQLPPGVGR